MGGGGGGGRRHRGLQAEEKEGICGVRRERGELCDKSGLVGWLLNHRRSMWIDDQQVREGPSNLVLGSISAAGSACPAWDWGSRIEIGHLLAHGTTAANRRDYY